MFELARLFKALSDPNRLRIVNILSRRTACVCDLQAILDLPQTLISRHLAYLRSVEMVRDRREGARVCYSLVLDGLLGEGIPTFLRELLSRSENFQSDLQKLAEYEGAGRAGRGRSSQIPTTKAA